MKTPKRQNLAISTTATATVTSVTTARSATATTAVAKKFARQKSAFSLIEVVFCIAVLGVMAAASLRFLSNEPRPRDAANSVARDLNYAAQVAYSSPWAQINTAAGGTNMQSHLLWRVKFQTPALEWRGSKTRVGDVYLKNSGQSYKIMLAPPGKTDVFSRKYGGKMLHDYLDRRKFFNFPTSYMRAKKRHFLYKNMPPRLDLAGRFHSIMRVYIGRNSHPGGEFLTPVGGARGYRQVGVDLFINPATGQFMLPRMEDINFMDGRFIWPAEVGGFMLLQLRADSLSPTESDDFKRRLQSACVLVQAGTAMAYVPPFDEHGQEIARFYDPVKGAFKCYCHQIRWDGLRANNTITSANIEKFCTRI